MLKLPTLEAAPRLAAAVATFAPTLCASLEPPFQARSLRGRPGRCAVLFGDHSDDLRYVSIDFIEASTAVWCM
jgi:hypothetical protein